MKVVPVRVVAQEVRLVPFAFEAIAVWWWRVAFFPVACLVWAKQLRRFEKKVAWTVFFSVRQKIFAVLS
jgi:hypothetical protein